MITAPKHLTTHQKTIFRALAKQMVDLKTLHAVDKYQIELAAVLTAQAQATASRLEQLDHFIEAAEDSTQLARLLESQSKVQAMYHKNAGVLNSTLDKLGISNTKRNPVKEQRGRPENSPGEAPDNKQRRKWKQTLQAVK